MPNLVSQLSTCANNYKILFHRSVDSSVSCLFRRSAIIIPARSEHAFKHEKVFQ